MRTSPFQDLRRQLWMGAAAILVVTVLGTLGYVLLGGWTFFDGLYMTVITLATVGYGETQPMGTGLRAFTIALIVAGVVAVGNLVNLMARAISEGYFERGLRDRRMKSEHLSGMAVDERVRLDMRRVFLQC